MTIAAGGNQTVDPQFTNVQILRPPDGFEADYQGLATTVPIAFPGTLDPRAGTVGYDANLMAGYSVPEGSKVCLWFPLCFAPGSQTPVIYSYRLIWRHRPIDGRDPRNTLRNSKVWHMRRVVGAPNGAAARFAVPAAWHVLGYEQLEPTTGPGVLNLRVEEITPIINGATEFAQPLLPGGTPGVIEQGLFDPTTNLAGTMPTCQPFLTDAGGDELIILATRANLTAPLATWDFTNPANDQAFSNVYGTNNGGRAAPFPGVGIYLQTGVLP